MTKEDIAIVLKQLRQKAGYTQKEAAEKLGKKQQTIASWETGQSQPDANTLFFICSIYGTTVDEAFGFNKDNQRISKEDLELLRKYRTLDDIGRTHVNTVLSWELERIESTPAAVETVTIPRRVISYYQRLASAGSGEYLFDSVPIDTIEVPITSLSEEADFVIGVNGDSMEPTYYNGEKVFVKISDEIPTGSIGIFTRGNECFIKELGIDRLISHNIDKVAYPDIPASEDIHCVGLILGKVEE